MPRIIDNAPLGWQDILDQEGYKPPVQSPFGLSAPQPLMGPAIPLDDPSFSAGQKLTSMATQAGYVPAGQYKDYSHLLPQQQEPSTAPYHGGLEKFDPALLKQIEYDNLNYPVSRDKKYAARDKAAARRKATQERLQPQADAKQMARLNRMDPKKREFALKRVNDNRARRGLGPLEGPTNTGQFIDVTSFTNLDPAFHSVGQPVRDSQGNEGIVQEQPFGGGLYVHPLTVDPITGQKRPAPTSEEQLELDRETEEHQRKMADMDARTKERRFKNFESTLGPKEFGEWQSLRFNVTRLEDSVVEIENEVLRYEGAAEYDEDDNEAKNKEDLDPKGNPYRKNSPGHLDAARDLHKARADLRVANENQRRYRQEHSDSLEQQRDEKEMRDMSPTESPPEQQEQQVNMPTISEQSDFDALPSGAHYIDAGDGKEHVKP